ncbi:PQ loop repeat [Popillia japonica]|uniref:Cystinosin homolog n=1 Tax=Popillia japonica TaxID=7064 RepID=A0AAW1KK86_POPJA
MCPRICRKLCFAIIAFACALTTVNCDIWVDKHDIRIKLKETAIFHLYVSSWNYTDVTLQFYAQHDDIVKVTPSTVNIIPGNDSYAIELQALGAGNSDITSNTTNSNISTENVFLRVTVFKNGALDIFSTVIGWIYFVAWSISFYPQIYINYRRKSVIGLNFDFLYLNIVGFALYGLFNLGLYFIPEIQDEYFTRYPRGLNPVQVNDIVFAVHAFFACVITIGQTYIYERGEQRVSITAKTILGIFSLFLLISIILSSVDVIHWLDFLYYCSYVKLTITLIKYIPQAYMNYKRQSTVGWSIGNIFLDFTGGMLSMMQMIINAHNYDDWVSIFGDPTKFGLGLFSVIFDIFFITQHYVLYRHSRYEEK